MINPAPHKARKRFGQNFLQDPNIIRKIIQSVRPAPEDLLVEIGPGQGAITQELLRAAGRLQAVELDRDLIAPLARSCQNLGELTIHNVDALRFDFCQLKLDARPLRLVGNLPYNISTPLLFSLLEQADCIGDMHFMLQKEVVDRMAACPGTKTYGRLSVSIQARCRVEPLFLIKPGAFKPMPKVDSAFVRLIPHTTPVVEIEDMTHFNRLVAKAFSQRRKTLRNSLKDEADASQLIAAGIEPTQRAEQLSLEQFAKLSNTLCTQEKAAEP